MVVSLSHPELDSLSSEGSAQRFAELERRVTHALDAAREAKESTFGSFDLLVTRIGQRTNDIMKVLTLVTVILLPATVLGGITGMNFQVGLFDLAWVFWVVIAAMLGMERLDEDGEPRKVAATVQSGHPGSRAAGSQSDFAEARASGEARPKRDPLGTPPGAP